MYLNYLPKNVKHSCLSFLQTCFSIAFIFLLLTVTVFTVSAQENALTFDGTDEYATLPNISETGNFTVEWWVNPNTYSEWNQMMQAGNGWGSFMFHTTNTGGVYVGTDVSTRLTPTELPAGTVQLNTWQHFAYSFDGTNGRFYKDGVLLGTKATIASVAWNGFIIGSTASTNTINGEIDELRIWNDVRTSGEIAANMCDIPTYASEANLVSYYKFNQTSGSASITDLKGGNHGVLINLEPASDWVSGTCRPMTYVSSNVVQTNTNHTLISSTNQEIIGVNVLTIGDQTPLDLTQLVINTAGSSAPLTDISNIRIYYTGNSAAFATTNLYGTVASANTATAINVNGSQTLVEGDNYFWIAYDIAPAATASNVVDAQCTSVTVNDGNGAQTPAPTTVLGDRVILNFTPSPGGVNNEQVWLLSNSGVAGTAPVTGWSNQGNNTNITTLTGGTGSVLVTNEPYLNFHDAVRTGSSYYTGSFHQTIPNRTSLISSDEVTMFIVTNLNQDLTISFHSTISAVNQWEAFSFRHGAIGATFSSGVVNTYNASFAQGNMNIYGMRGKSNSFGENSCNGLKTSINNVGTFTSSVAPYELAIGYWPGFTSSKEFTEAIIWDKRLTADEFHIVETYLAIKYGVTLGINGTSQDYNSSTNAVVWNSATNSGYAFDIAGIGRDDNSVLAQYKSHSVNGPNTTNFNDILTIANGANFNAPSAMVNQSYFIWGHNGGPKINTGAVVNYTTDNGENIETIFQRQWKSQETGTVTDVVLEFDLSDVMGAGGIVGNNNLSHLRLLVDEDGDFSNGATSYTATAFDNTTNIATFTHDFKASNGNPLTSDNGFFFTLASTNAILAPLPIELAHFTANCISDGQVSLEWETSSELNNDYFTIEKSYDGFTFKHVTNVDSKGTTNISTKYNSEDYARANGVIYYRLSQTDMDGTIKVVGTRSVICETPTLAIYPNPFNNQFVVESDKDGSISLRDVMGKIVFQENYKAGKTNFSVENLADGVFFVEFKNENGTIKEMKLVKY